MGLSAAASLGSNIVPRGTNETIINCQLFCGTQQNSVGFKFSKHNKAIHRAIFQSKQESIELNERRSPNEASFTLRNLGLKNNPTPGAYNWCNPLMLDTSLRGNKEIIAQELCSELIPQHGFSRKALSMRVKEEIKQCYELINRLGRGVLYLGSSRMGPSHSHYMQAQELAKEIANLLDCTTWSGAGPGLMDAVTQGAMKAGKPVGGFKIGKEAGEWTASNFHPYLPSENYLTCRFFSARKHGLVDAVVRNNSFDKTAVVALPGGIGTLDEVFEILALIQLERIGSKLPVPFLLMNYDSFYSKLLDFLDVCEDWETVSKGEVASLWKVCNSNTEALAYLADFYCISSSDTSQKNVTKLHNTRESPS